MFFLAHYDVIVYDSISHPKIPEEFKKYNIFLIADIHKRKIRQQTIEKIKHSIDIVCIAGDILEKGVPLKRVQQNIALLKSWNVPIYFVWGNNDYEIDTVELGSLLEREGVIILADTIVSIKKENRHITLCGLDYYLDDKIKNPVINDLETNNFTMLLTHKPNAYFKLADSKKANIDFVMAGHTHGGQIRLFGLGPYKRGGIVRDKETVVCITEGYGYTLLPLRLGTRAECHVLTLE